MVTPSLPRRRLSLGTSTPLAGASRSRRLSCDEPLAMKPSMHHFPAVHSRNPSTLKVLEATEHLDSTDLQILLASPGGFQFPEGGTDLDSSDGDRNRSAKASKSYTRVFPQQYGGLSYMITRPPAKARYLDFRKKSKRYANRDGFKTAVEAGVRNNAMEFEAADKNMDQHLDFDEFKGLVRSRMSKERSRSEAQLMAWYKALDTDGDGVLSMSEFFAFSLRESFLRANTGQPMEEFFKHWDSGGDSKLDRDEFTKLAERVGFGGVADELLAACDTDGSGVIEYSECTSTRNPSKHLACLLCSHLDRRSSPSAQLLACSALRLRIRTHTTSLWPLSGRACRRRLESHRGCSCGPGHLRREYRTCMAPCKRSSARHSCTTVRKSLIYSTKSTSTRTSSYRW